MDYRVECRLNFIQQGLQFIEYRSGNYLQTVQSGLHRRSEIGVRFGGFLSALEPSLDKGICKSQ